MEIRCEERQVNGFMTRGGRRGAKEMYIGTSETKTFRVFGHYISVQKPTQTYWLGEKDLRELRDRINEVLGEE